MFKVDDNRFLRKSDGTLAAPFVTSFVAAEMVFSGASVICCRLWDGTVLQENEVSPEDAHQFRMTAATARRLAKLLNQAADDLDGIDQPQH